MNICVKCEHYRRLYHPFGTDNDDHRQKCAAKSVNPVSRDPVSGDEIYESATPSPGYERTTQKEFALPSCLSMNQGGDCGLFMKRKWFRRALRGLIGLRRIE